MACNCKQTDSKAWLRKKGATTQSLHVRVKSSCLIPKSDDGDDDRTAALREWLRSEAPREHAGVREGGEVRKADAHAARPASGRRRAERDEEGCFATYEVTLVRSTGIDGARIAEVQFGSDVFGASIAEGEAEVFVLECDEGCSVQRGGSVRVVDKNGALVARLTRFKICECGGSVH